MHECARQQPGITLAWLRKYANMHKRSSYQDKLQALKREINPYYLLEWLLYPPSPVLRDELNDLRSPALLKNSMLPFSQVFFDQLLYDAFIRQGEVFDYAGNLLETAVWDLRNAFGSESWDHAVNRLQQKISVITQTYEQYKVDLEKEILKLESDLERQLQELEPVGGEAPDSERLHEVREAYRRKKEEAPRRLFNKKYETHPILALFITYPDAGLEQRLGAFRERIAYRETPSLAALMKENEPEAVLRTVSVTEQTQNQFLRWFRAYASKTDLLRGLNGIERRLQWWAGCLEFIAAHPDFLDRKVEPFVQLTFELSGFSEFIVKGSDLPIYIHLLVRTALKDESRSKQLADTYVLRYWQLFSNAFFAEEYRFEQCSWVLCLDPDSLLQRLLRRDSTADKSLRSKTMGPEFVVERCCAIFYDAVKAGIADRVLPPLFHYLSIHDMDTMYSFIYKSTTFHDLLPLLEMREEDLRRLLHGDSVRAAAARRWLHSLFLAGVGLAARKEADSTRLRKLAVLLAPEKGELAVKWLDRINGLPLSDWPSEEATLLESLLQIEWLGRLNTAVPDETNKLLQNWLQNHSDWIVFEAEPKQLHAEALHYTILRPGCMDRLNGRILARVLVRAQLADSREIAGMLDDLKNI